MVLERSVQLLDGCVPMHTHKHALLYKHTLHQPESEALLLDMTSSDSFFHFMLVSVSDVFCLVFLIIGLGNILFCRRWVACSMCTIAPSREA